MTAASKCPRGVAVGSGVGVSVGVGIGVSVGGGEGVKVGSEVGVGWAATTVISAGVVGI